MNRRDTVIALLAYGVVPLDAWAQQPRKVIRIGWLSPSSPSGFAPQLGAFRQGLRERGYIEGQNIVIEYRFGGEGTDLVGDLAAELVRLKVDILVPVSGPAVRAAKDATGTIPIVAHDLQTDPVRAGLVASLARPGGNLTGFFLDLAELGGKHVELLKEAVPGLSRVAALWPAASSPYPLRAAEAAARSLEVQLQVLEVRGPDDFERAFEAAIRGRAQALIVFASPLFFSHRAAIVGPAAKGRLP